jgi:peptidoglycan/LPS O-acetylase OafA/YrhL
MTQIRGRIDAIDGWRAISVAMVIAGHIVNFSAVRDHTSVETFGGLGVQIVFVMSGFVITRGLLRISLQGFYVRRVFRIFAP